VSGSSERTPDALDCLACGEPFAPSSDDPAEHLLCDRCRGAEASDRERGAARAEEAFVAFGWVIAVRMYDGTGWAPIVDTAALTRNEAIRRFEASGRGIYRSARKTGRVRSLRCAVIPTDPHVPLNLRSHDVQPEDDGR
jgi:hypothetical protein